MNTDREIDQNKKIGKHLALCSTARFKARGAVPDYVLDRCNNIEAFDSEPKAWFYQEAETDRNTFAVISLWGKFGDSAHAEPHFRTSCHYQIFF